ncbi:MAG: hypothetical protein JST68_00560 [Bacteroidetes bacterium]|nr:hypothetical protein [Bacteroidota bacterium]
MVNFKRKMNERSPRATSSESWRRSIWPQIWLGLQGKGFEENEISDVYLLTFTLFSEQALTDVTELIEGQKIKTLTRVIENVPDDFDLRDNELLQIFYIATNSRSYLALFKETGHVKEEFVRIFEIDSFDIKLFLGRSLVYPI